MKKQRFRSGVGTLAALRHPGTMGRERGGPGHVSLPATVAPCVLARVVHYSQAVSVPRSNLDVRPRN